MKNLNVKDIAKQVIKKGDNKNKIDKTNKVDAIIAHKVWGLVVFALVMFVVFFISQTVTATFTEEVLVAGLESLQETFGTWLESMDTNQVISGILVDGIFGGFIAIIGFLPLIMVLFFLLTLLEDSGYMSRVSLVMDRYFRKVGLSGKSIIPMYIGTACSIPGILGSRTIKNEKQGRITALLTPFMPCGAKLPVIALFMGAFFSDSPFVTPIIYLLSILIIFLAALIIKFITNTRNARKEDTYMLVELPEFKVPSFKYGALIMLERAKEFIIKAGTIIVLFNTLIWVLINFDTSFNFIGGEEEIANSILYTISAPFAGAMAPLGLGGPMAWAFLVAAIIGLVAKENIVAAIFTIFAIANNEGEVEEVASVVNALQITSAAAFGYMAMNLFVPPCVAAISAMRAELNSWKWTTFAILFQIAFGYVIGIISYQILEPILAGQIGQNLLAAIIIVVVFVAIIVLMSVQAKRKKWLAKL